MFPNLPALQAAAADPATPGDRLAELARMPDVAALVAANPNTPWRALVTLAPAHPLAVAHNPILQFLVLENPLVLHELSLQGALALLRVSDIPPWIAQSLATYAPTNYRNTPRWAEHVQEAARLHVQFAPEHETTAQDVERALATAQFYEGTFPTDIDAISSADWLLEWLASHEVEAVRQYVAQRHDAPPELLDRIAKDPAPVVRVAVAANPHLSRATVRRLAHDDDAGVRGEVTKHWTLSRRLQERLASDTAISVQSAMAGSDKVELDIFLHHPVPIIVGCALARNPHAPAALLARLATYPRPGFREDAEYRLMLRQVAEHGNTPAETLSALISQRDEQIRRALAQNPHTPPETLAVLAHDRRKLVAYPAIQHPALPPDVLRDLVTSTRVAIRMCVGSNPTTPPDVLAMLAHYHNADTLAIVAAHPHTPVRILRSCASDSRPRVRAAVAQNSALPVLLMEVLAKDRDVTVRWQIARRVDAPPEVVRQLAHDDEAEIRRAVASHPALPAEAMIHLVADDTLSRTLAARPDAPPEALTHIARHSSSYLACASVARHPRTPVTTLADQRNDSFAVVRCAAVQNPRTPGVTITPRTPASELNKLSRNRDPAIRAAVAAQRQTPAEVLLRLAHDDVAFVRKTVALNPAAPPGVLEALAADSRVHPHLALHPQASPDMLVRFALSRNYNTQLAITRRAYTPPQILNLLCLHRYQHITDAAREALARQKVTMQTMDLSSQAQNDIVRYMLSEDHFTRNVSLFARLLLLSSPVLRAEALAQHTQSPYWLERFVVARHPYASEAMLRELSDDGNRVVRATARARI